MGNQTKILSEVVDIDAWHEPLSIDKSSAVFVEVAFKEARIGGNDSDFPYTFKMKLKKALLSIKLEDPLEIDKSSIARSNQELEATISKIRTARNALEETSGGSIQITPSAIAAQLTTGSITKSDITEEDSIQIVQSLPAIAISSRPSTQREHFWAMEATFRPHMEGQPWDPLSPPRMHVKPLVKIGKLHPAISVQLTCAFEDVIIEDIQLKEINFKALAKEAVGWREREKVAIQHLKVLLMNAELEVSDLENRFENLVLAELFAYEN